jgi:hypothetical protein
VATASGGTPWDRASAAAQSALVTLWRPELALDRRGHAHPDAGLRRRRGEQRGDAVVVEVGDCDRGRPHPRLDLDVGRHRAVPVQVIGREVQQRAGRWTHGLRPVQLEARHLDGQHVVGGRRQHGVDDRYADVADRAGAPSGRDEHRFEHADGRGLAVRAGDCEPGRTAPVPQLPGELDLAPDRNPDGRCVAEQRVVGTQPG